MNRIILRNRIKKADVIWMGNPLHYKYVKRKEGQTLVYDCMDDLMPMPEQQNQHTVFHFLIMSRNVISSMRPSCAKMQMSFLHQALT